MSSVQNEHLLAEYRADQEERRSKSFAPQATEVQKRHLRRIRDLVVKMRRSLRRSEEANALYNSIRGELKEKNLSRGDLAARLDNNFDAKVAVADNIMYDRWATKYAAIVSAEIAAYKLGIHVDNWSEKK